MAFQKLATVFELFGSHPLYLCFEAVYLRISNKLMLLSEFEKNVLVDNR